MMYPYAPVLLKRGVPVQRRPIIRTARMADEIAELIAFAEELHSSIPTSGTAPDRWMVRAKDFASACLIGNDLKPALESAIPLRSRGDLHRALISVRTAGEMFRGAMTAIDVTNSLTLIITYLKHATPDSRKRSSWLEDDIAEADVKLPLASSKAFDSDIASAILECSSIHPLAALMMDVDHFKDVNDTYGHQVGDDVLMAVADAVRQCLLGKGKGYRFGVEELTALIPNFDMLEAVQTAERIRIAVEALSFSTAQLHVTISIGVACCTETSMAAASLIAEADKLMYDAKKGGRNRVVSTAATESFRSSGAQVAAAPNAVYLDNPPPSPVYSRFPEGSFSYSDANGEHRLELPSAEHLFLWIGATPTNLSLSSKTAREAIQKGRLKPMGGELLGSISERNVVGSFICQHETYTITYLTQLHNNGDLFGMDFESVSKARRTKNAGITFGILPAVRFERVFTSTLANYLDVAANTLRLPLPLSVTAGVSGIRGFRLSVSPEIFGNPYIGKALHPTIADPIQVSSYDKPIASLLRPFFNHVWEEFGEDRPDVEQLDPHA